MIKVKTNPDESVSPEDKRYLPRFNTHGYGLTKREYFAALAMQGLQTSNFEELLERDMDVHKIARIALEQADALIEELNKKTSK